jgi:hypothetical protein
MWSRPFAGTSLKDNPNITTGCPCPALAAALRGCCTDRAVPHRRTQKANWKSTLLGHTSVTPLTSGACYPNRTQAANASKRLRLIADHRRRRNSSCEHDLRIHCFVTKILPRRVALFPFQHGSEPAITRRGSAPALSPHPDRPRWRYPPARPSRSPRSSAKSAA